MKMVILLYPPKKLGHVFMLRGSCHLRVVGNTGEKRTH